eukprot:4919289-Prymnesium_polylepis.1
MRFFGSTCSSSPSKPAAAVEMPLGGSIASQGLSVYKMSSYASGSLFVRSWYLHEAAKRAHCWAGSEGGALKQRRAHRRTPTDHISASSMSYWSTWSEPLCLSWRALIFSGELYSTVPAKLRTYRAFLQSQILERPKSACDSQGVHT